MTSLVWKTLVTLASTLALLGCGAKEVNTPVAPADVAAEVTAEDAAQDVAVDAPTTVTGTYPVMDLDADLSVPEHFYDQPFPSDARKRADGTFNLTGFPVAADATIAKEIVGLLNQRKGASVMSPAWFRLSAPLSTLKETDLIAADKGSPILLVDVDPASPERGKLFPVVAITLVKDAYTPENLVGVAPRPGIVLVGGRTYATVLTTALKDSAGQPIVPAATMKALANGQLPAGKSSAGVAASLMPLFDTLGLLGIAPTAVAGATVFTTEDVVKEVAELSTQLVGTLPVTITGLEVDPDDGATHERFCELRGEVSMPQFQVGTPPFNTDGLFAVDAATGLPKVQRQEKAPIRLTLPKSGNPMPKDGYPLVVYLHGSGNLSSEVVDRGPVSTPDGPHKKGEGAAFVLAPHGFATAGQALPLNPERLPGAGDTEYLNVGNPKAMRDTFRQGVIESRMFIEALSKLTVSPTVVAKCSGLTLPAGESAFKLDVVPLMAMGNSMGGMYTNLVGAVEPRVRAAVPSGAAGFWTYFILDNPYQPVGDIIGPLLFATDVKMTLLHPGLAAAQWYLESADPIVYVPRLGKRPLAGHPARHIYEPVGKEDKYFPTTLFDAVALAYGNQQAGTEHWPSMQKTLTLGDAGGLASYPIRQNLTSSGGGKYTGAVIQYSGNGQSDPHSIISQLDEVKYQYGCLLRTTLDTGVGVIPAPAKLGTPCPAP